MKTKYIWTNRLMILLACLALITLSFHIYTNWSISGLWLYHAHGSKKVIDFAMKTFWYSSIPVFLFLLLTSIAGFWRKRIYLPVFFILFFWLGGVREFQEIGFVFHGYLQFGISFILVAWSSVLMLSCAIATTISWIVEYFLQSKNKG